ncbi:MAG: metallophosphoesterase family protein [Longimicrobiales bacterium]
MRTHVGMIITLLAALTGPVPALAQSTAEPWSFVVLGHIRGGEDGNPHYFVDEILDEVRALQPDLLFLTGDMIWGDVLSPMADSASVVRDWARLDTMLAELSVRVHRVPGNHDIHDPVTRDVYTSRYGRPPHLVDHRRNRFLLLSSAHIPPGDTLDGSRRQWVRGKQLESPQIEFVRQALADTAAYDNAFVLMHHMLWWEDDADWWRDVHPLLVGRKVRAVFAGDYGPMKFSHVRRDRIDYVQSSVENNTGLQILRNRIQSRLLYQQFDNLLRVTVTGDRADVAVIPVGAFTGGKFTPQRWREINEYEAPRTLTQRGWDRLEVLAGGPRRALALLVGTAGLLGLALGAALALVIGRRRRTATQSSPRQAAAATG